MNDEKTEDKDILDPKNDPHKKTKDLICRLIENGRDLVTACGEAGIHHATGYRWRKRDAKFAKAIELAFLKYRGKLIDIVNKGSMRNPEIALIILERRDPANWGEKPKRIETYDPRAELARINDIIYGKQSHPKSDPGTDSAASELDEGDA